MKNQDQRSPENEPAEATAATAAAPPVIEVYARTAELVPVTRDLEDERRELAAFRRAEEDYLGELARLENGAAIIARRGEQLEMIRRAAIRATMPTDWVLNKDGDGNELAMLTSQSASKIAPFYGVSLANLRPCDDLGIFTPRRTDLGGGVFEMTAAADAFCRLTGRQEVGLSITRRSDEPFTGRAIDGAGRLTQEKTGMALPSDVAQSCHTGLLNKAVKRLCGFGGVPRAELDSDWSGQFMDAAKTIPKTTELCRFGHGYGSAAQRRAGKVQDEGVDETREVLRQTLLALAGGSQDQARALLVKITKTEGTAKKKAFAGNDDLRRMTQTWQFENAFARLLGDLEHGPAAKSAMEAARARVRAAKPAPPPPPAEGAEKAGGAA